VGCFVVMSGPAIRYYKANAASLRCLYRYYQVYFGWLGRGCSVLRFWWGDVFDVALPLWLWWRHTAMCLYRLI